MADGRKNNGGHKTAGRKPKIKEVELIEKLTPLEPLALKALEDGLNEGEFPFVKMYFEYRYGKPKEKKDLTTNGKDIVQSIIISDEIAKELNDNLEDEY